MSIVYKYFIFMMLSCLLSGNGVFAADSGLELAQGQNATLGSGTRDFAPVNEGAREINEGEPGNPNLDPQVNPAAIDRIDGNDPDEGYDTTAFTLFVLIASALAVALLMAYKQGFVKNAQEP